MSALPARLLHEIPSILKNYVKYRFVIDLSSLK